MTSPLSPQGRRGAQERQGRALHRGASSPRPRFRRRPSVGVGRRRRDYRRSPRTAGDARASRRDAARPVRLASRRSRGRLSRSPGVGFARRGVARAVARVATRGYRPRRAGVFVQLFLLLDESITKSSDDLFYPSLRAPLTTIDPSHPSHPSRPPADQGCRSGVHPEGGQADEDRLHLHRGGAVVQDGWSRRRRRLAPRRARQARPQGHDHLPALRPVQGRVGHVRQGGRHGQAGWLLPREQEGRRPRLRRPPAVPRQGVGQDGVQAVRENQRRGFRG
eukprot:29307-Pelagococcus_subviridis.AAC.10